MQKWIWKLFYLLIAVILTHSVGLLFGIHLSQNLVFHFVLLILPILLVILHAIYTLGIGRSLFFIIIASGIGWLMETEGLKYGTIFGGRYIYEGNPLTIGIVPLAVILYWGVFIYTGYSIVCAFFYWRHKKKPNKKNNPIFQILPLVLLDGVIVIVIDLFMDPIQVKAGTWQWLDGGIYFGVPLGNFFGWFLTTIIVTGIFRFMEYLLPAKDDAKDTSVFILPTIAYGMLAISFSISAIQYRLYSLAIIGLFLMVPIVITNLYLYLKYNKLKRNRRF